jgi:hypothetical protein
MLEIENKPEILPVISAGITGTSFMTLFSYLVSTLQKENFKEPEILARLIYRLVAQMNKGYSQVAGWNLHYLVGLLFAFYYAKLWQKKVKPTVISGLILGGITGILAMIVWKLTLNVHPSPPKIKFRRFYSHIIVAHLVFGCFASIGYVLMRSRRLPGFQKGDKSNRSILSI